MNIFERFFKDQEQEVGPSLQLAHEILEMASLAHFPRVIQWLEHEAMRPIKMASGQDMLLSAARQNALLEVREHLLHEVQRAKALLESENG